MKGVTLISLRRQIQLVNVPLSVTVTTHRRTGKWMKQKSCLFALILSSIAAVETFCQKDEKSPVKDVFRVMEIVESYNTNDLWPGFRPSEIPIMVFDSLNTLIFNTDIPPQGFSEVNGHPGVFIFTGQHPLVRGNSIVRTGDKWIATSVLSSSSVRTGEKYTERDLAGIIIHEQFHIFQRNKHPCWQPNDGLLLLYPPETEEALLCRRFEKEAFRKAVLAGKQEEIINWCNEALKQRRQRLSMVHNVFGLYEMELQRTEGLSDYIEKVARGLDPLNSSNITNGIAPAGIRDLGYVEGRLRDLRLEINASSKPLNIRIFEPLEIETLENRSVFHRLIFMAGNEAGSVRIMNQSCITRFDGSLRIEKLIITGLKDTPEVNKIENKLIIRNNNITIELKYSDLEIDNSRYIFKL